VVARDIRFPTSENLDGSDALDERKLMLDANQVWDVDESLKEHALEYGDHLHEHFVDPVRMEGGRHVPPSVPGYSIQMKPESLDLYEFPNGRAWIQQARSNV